jgi:uncharacterized protein YbaR (Trm112 family)
MKLSDFDKHYPTEKSCIIRFKEMCIQSGVVCPHCGHREHLWLPASMHFECKNCHHLQSLRSGTIIHSSKLPFLYWFEAIHLMTSTKKDLFRIRDTTPVRLKTLSTHSGNVPQDTKCNGSARFRVHLIRHDRNGRRFFLYRA